MFYDNPLYTLSNQVFFHCSFDFLEFYGFRIGYLKVKIDGTDTKR